MKGKREDILACIPSSIRTAKGEAKPKPTDNSHSELFGHSISHIDPTAKYHGLPRRIFSFSVLVFDFGFLFFIF